jgi:PA14 domain
MLRRVRAIAFLLWLLASLSLGLLPPTGLRGEYFSNESWSAPPTRTSIDRNVTTAQIRRGWGYTPPDQFTVRWTGFLFVTEPSDYTFTLTSDDGSELYVDRRLVVDNRGPHAAMPRSGDIRLEPGSHSVLIQYSQVGGPYALEWTWSAALTPDRPVPSWRLSPRAVGGPAPLVARYVGSLSWPWLTLVCVVLAWQMAYARGYWPRPLDARRIESQPAANETRGLSAGRLHGPPGGLRRRASGTWPAVISLLLFVVLAVVHTWPLATAPGRLSRNDNADTDLNEWALAWVAHQLPRDPLRVFDANIFHPERNTLAYSEALLVQGVIAAPPLWMGASPVLAYNLVLLAGFVLTAWAMSLVVTRWTGDRIAGFVAGTVVAFNAHTLTRLPQIQAQHAEFLPLALLALDELLNRPRWSPAIWLAAGVVLQALASIYLFVFTIVALFAGLLVRPEDWVGRRLSTVSSRVAIAAALTSVVLLPYLSTYWTVHAKGFVRSLDETAWFAAHLRDYLTTPSRWYPWAGGDVALFPGVAALVLSLVAISGRALADSRARMGLAIASVGVLLSFGPAVVPGYEQAFATLPLLQAVRTTSRFGYLAFVGMAILAGYGVALLRRRLAQLWLRFVVAGIAVGAVAVEPLAAPITYEVFHGIRPIYDLVRAEPDAVVVELPFPPPENLYRNAQYLLNSTVHWKPMLNGYSGFAPPSYAANYAALNGFPSDRSIDALRQAGVTHVFVHLDGFDQAALAMIDTRPELQRIAFDGSIALFRLRR